MFSLEFEAVEAVVAHDDTRYVWRLTLHQLIQSLALAEQQQAVSVGKKCPLYLNVSVESLEQGLFNSLQLKIMSRAGVHRANPGMVEQIRA